MTKTKTKIEKRDDNIDTEIISSTTITKINEPNISDVASTISNRELCMRFKDYLRTMHIRGTETLFTCNQMVTYVDMMIVIKELLNLPNTTPAEVKRSRILAIFGDLSMFPPSTTMSTPSGGLTIHNLQMHLTSLRLHMIQTPDDKVVSEVYDDLERTISPKHDEWKQYVDTIVDYIRSLS